MTLRWFKLRSGIVCSTEEAHNRKEKPKETRQAAASQSGSIKRVVKLGLKKSEGGIPHR